MPQLRIRLLGVPEIKLDGVDISVDTRKAIALLAYLVMSEQPQSRSTLGTLFWPESDEEHSRSALRRTLNALNNAIGRQWIVTERTTLALPRQADLWVDVQVFRDLLAEGLPKGEENDCGRALSPLREAIALYRGDFLAGFTLFDSPGFDEWQSFHSESLRQELAGALRSLLHCYLAQGEYAAAIQTGRHWLSLDTLHEPAHQALMRAYAQAGQRAVALRQYEECVRILDEELGVPPQRETTALYEKITAGEFEGRRSTATAVAPLPTPLVRLPRQLTSFIGREEEMAEIHAFLDHPNGRLVTIIGPGGMGKTRLALEAAATRKGRYAHGLTFVPLAPVRSADTLLATLADALEFSFYGGNTNQEAMQAQLLDFLREKEMLLVLDNFEHLLAGVDLIEAILRRTQNVQLLVTSQERLNLLGECLVEIHGLQCPGPNMNDIESCSAVALFVQRASQVNADFALTEEQKPFVAQICRLVGGLPLGLELASTWARMLTCREIAGQIEHDLDFLASSLRNLPERHRSLRAVFEHSWRLLSEMERSVFLKLSVFPGGFDMDAAAFVAGASLPLLLTLTDKSLLQRGADGRYHLPEVLRQYALEKFDPESQSRIQADHARYYTHFLRARETALTGERQATALAEIGEEIENIRQAWRWAVTQRDEAALEPSLEAMYRFYQTRSWFQEGSEAFAQVVAIATENSLLLGKALSRQGRLQVRMVMLDEGQATLQQALAILRSFNVPSEVAAVLSILGVVAEMKGDYVTARTLQKESQSLYHAIGETWGEANVLLRLGNVAYMVGEFEDARHFYRESMILRQQTGDRRGVALCLNNMGSVADNVGEYEEALRLYRESMVIKREIGDRRGVAYSLNNLGHLGWQMGTYPTAEADLREALAIFREIGDRKGTGFALTNLGNLAYAQGDYEAAHRFYEDSLAVCQEINYLLGVAYARNHLGNTSRARQQHGEARAHYQAAMQAAQAVQATPVVLEIWVEVAALLLAEGELTQAVSLLTMARHQPTIRKHSQERADKLLSEIRMQMDGEAFAAAQNHPPSLEEALVRFL